MEVKNDNYGTLFVALVSLFESLDYHHTTCRDKIGDESYENLLRKLSLCMVKQYIATESILHLIWCELMKCSDYVTCACVYIDHIDAFTD